MRTKFCMFVLLCGGIFLVGTSGIARAADDIKAKADALPTKVDPQVYQKAVDGGVNFLLKTQSPDGAFNPPDKSPAYTAIALTALMRSGLSPDSPTVAKGLKYLEGFVQSDGGIYKSGSAIQNYETGIAIMCFAEANKNGRYKNLIKAAENYVKSIQWGASGDLDKSAVNYGGAGYGRSKTRPDLSNTSFLLDALQAAGDEANDEAVQRALVFVSRCQNLATDYNTTPFAAKNPDGGFYYTPSDGGQSAPGGKTDDDGLRSYGSMTYAGLKSMIFAGLKPDDVRVKAAVDWIKKHYTLADNPGMGQKGLYYGYHTFAKALHSLGQDPFIDDKDVKHAWKAELVEALIQRQKENGSWVNTDSLFDEGNPNLVTSYALLTLSYCKPGK